MIEDREFDYFKDGWTSERRDFIKSYRREEQALIEQEQQEQELMKTENDIIRAALNYHADAIEKRLCNGWDTKKIEEIPGLLAQREQILNTLAAWEFDNGVTK